MLIPQVLLSQSQKRKQVILLSFKVYNLITFKLNILGSVTKKNGGWSESQTQDNPSKKLPETIIEEGNSKVETPIKIKKEETKVEIVDVGEQNLENDTVTSDVATEDLLIAEEKNDNDDISANKIKKRNSVDDSKYDNENKEDSSPRYQSSRAAAMLAKTRLSSKGKFDDKIDDSKGDNAAQNDQSQWVQCDACLKWRKIPIIVDTDVLSKESWFCNMNVWDHFHSSCDIPEESSDTIVDNDNDHSPKKKSNKGRKKSSNNFHEDDLSDKEQFDGTGRKRSVQKNISGSKSPVVEKVDWVQCNKCEKWRKVPGHINVTELPEVWYCSLNKWAPLMAKCSAKEESEPIGDEDKIDKGNKGKRGPGITTPIHSIIGSLPDGLKKVTQWVQCERRNCKKWRKLPGHVDMSQLPEKWYCEMNKWDIERASCDADETDSESELQANAKSRTQLIMNNSKGSGALSYRRIIFGHDGRIRTSFSEKNKNGYGLFSFVEAHRPNDANDYVDPTRRINYWSSSAYNESVVNSDIHSKGRIKKDKDTNKITDYEDTKFLKRSQKNENCEREPSYLIDCIRRIHSMDNVPKYVSTTPIQRCKTIRCYNELKLVDRANIECKIVKSCLLSSPTTSITMQNLLKVISSSRFLDFMEEICRQNMEIESLRAAVRRLELRGELEVVVNTIGEFVVQGVNSQHSDNIDQTLVQSSYGFQGLPLKLRKSSASISESKLINENLDRNEEINEKVEKKVEVSTANEQAKINIIALESVSTDDTNTVIVLDTGMTNVAETKIDMGTDNFENDFSR